MTIERGKRRYILPAGMSDQEFFAAKHEKWIEGDVSHRDVARRMREVATRHQRPVEEFDFALVHGSNRGLDGMWLLCWLRPRPEHCIQYSKEKAA